jgi:hypothetical protein
VVVKMSFIDNMKIGKKLIIGFLILVFIAAIGQISKVVVNVNTIVDNVTREVSRFRM